MNNRFRLSVAAAVAALGLASFASAASAMPRGDALAAKNLGSPNVETVQYRAARWRGGWRGRGWYGYRRGWYGPDWGWGAGFVGGAVVGTALAAPYYYGYGPGYYAPPPGPARMCWVTTDDRGYGYWAACR